MDMDHDAEISPLSSHSNEFTPINSADQKEVKQEIEDEEMNDQPLSSIKQEDTEEVTSTPVKGQASASVTNTNEKETPAPRKRGRKPAGSATTTPNKKAKGKKDAAAADGDGDAEAATPGTANDETGASSAAATPSKKAALPPIPTTLAAAGTEDRMILRMRDDENKPWPEINKVFVADTGIKVGASTLRMRYTTMKANFADISEEDEFRLVRLKKEIEEKFETEKWHRIVEAISQDGGGKYPAGALQKKFKELVKETSSAPAPVGAVAE